MISFVRVMASILEGSRDIYRILRALLHAIEYFRSCNPFRGQSAPPTHSLVASASTFLHKTGPNTLSINKFTI